MKSLLIIFIRLIFGLNCSGQSPRPLTKSDLTQIEAELEIRSQNLKDSLLKGKLGDDCLYIEFVSDTFKIEQGLRLKLDIDYSTNGMVVSTHDANREYDKLLNKYYQVLLRSLNEEDREILKKSQRNWIAFRDSELELNGVLMKDYYSGSGTIQRVLAAARVMEITKTRVIVLYHYLNRKMK